MVSPVDKEEDVGRRLPDDPALQPSKRRKLGDFQEHPGKTNAIDRPLMDSSSDDDDDDDKPLTQRRAFIKRKTDSTKELLQETRFTSSPPSQAPAADPSAEQISMLTKRKRPEPDLADSLQERGEGICMIVRIQWRTQSTDRCNNNYNFSLDEQITGIYRRYFR